MDFSDLETLHAAFTQDIENNGQNNVEKITQEIDLLGLPEVVSVVEPLSDPIQPKENKPKKKKNRCNHSDCTKKLGLIPFGCKCGGNFCANHRHIDTHDCTYDHKADYRRRLEETMPKVVADKIENRI
jgi:hypothetical protein